MFPRVKICCISSEEEAALAIRYGASALGLVGKMPSGPGVITDEMIHRIAMDEVQPYGLDLCSGLRTEGRLDERKVEAFFQELFV